MLIKELDKTKKLCKNQEQFEEILKVVEEDIKFNRVKFKKRTGPKKFIEILKITVGIMLRI